VANIGTFPNTSGVIIGPLTPRASQVLRRETSAATENTKIEKSAKDFESILLGSWLQQAEQSFGSLPGEDDEDSGKDQYQAMAMQSLGTSLTAAGGIGIAKMISTQLHKAEDARVVLAGEDHSGQTK
jgi:Rod binding domain-containing protein